MNYCCRDPWSDPRRRVCPFPDSPFTRPFPDPFDRINWRRFNRFDYW